MRVRPLLALTLFACTTPPPAKQDKAPADAKPEAPLAAKPVNAQNRASAECVGPFTDKPKRTLTIAGHEWELSGSTLTEKSHDPDESVAVGVVADLKEDTPENLTNIDKYVSFFRQEKAEFIFVDGDTGETKSQVANNLKRLAASGLPVGIIIGNRECEADFTAAVDEVAAKLPNVFNLNRVRHIVMDDAEFVTLPGYYNPAYLHCMQKGCQYFDEDVQALAPILDKAVHPVTLISHGPPRQHAPTGIDRISEGTNEGDPLLARFMQEHHVPFGLFANIHEAGGHATDLGGDNLVRENILVDSLYLNPGPGDSVRWQMNDSTESIGMAAAVIYKGKQASYRTFRLSQAGKKR